MAIKFSDFMHCSHKVKILSSKDYRYSESVCTEKEYCKIYELGEKAEVVMRHCKRNCTCNKWKENKTGMNSSKEIKSWEL